MDPITILASLAPLLVDGGKALIQKYFAPNEFKPTNIDDYIKMRTTDLEMFKVMNEAGSGSASYPWVEAVIKLMRPAVAISVLGTWGVAHFYYPDSANISTVDNFASAIGFYLFGDRTLFYARTGLVKPERNNG